MADTNSLYQIAKAAPAVQNTLNAWHLVALGAGAYLAHAYHSIKAAGGIKTILKCLWSGAPAPNAEGRMQKEETGEENSDARKSPASPELLSEGGDIVNRQSFTPRAVPEAGAPIPSPDTRHSPLL